MVQYTGADAAAALTILYRITSLIQSVPSGIMTASAILVGKSVGEYNKSQAFKYYLVAIYISVSFIHTVRPSGLI